MLSYASYDTTQYSCLHKNVNFAVDLWKEWETVNRELSAANKERMALKAEEDSSASTAVDDVACFLASLEMTPEERRRRAVDIIDAIRKSRMKLQTVEEKAHRTMLCTRFAMLYATLDKAQIRTDLSDVLTAQAGTQEKKKALEGRTGALTRRLNNVAAKYGQAFVNGEAPETYQFQKCPEDRVARRDWAWQILCDFVKDWAQRAKYHEVPVTIYGVSIATLEPEVQKIWQEAYEKLELGKAAKATGRFQARIAPKAVNV